MAGRSRKPWVWSVALCAAFPAFAIDVSSLPTPLRSEESGELRVTESWCADGDLGFEISDHGDVRRVVVVNRDACYALGVGVTVVPLGLLPSPIRRVQVVSCSFGPPGRYYCGLEDELAVAPTLFASGFDTFVDALD